MLMLLEARGGGERFPAFRAGMGALQNVLRPDVTLQVGRIGEVLVALIATKLACDRLGGGGGRRWLEGERGLLEGKSDDDEEERGWRTPRGRGGGGGRLGKVGFITFLRGIVTVVGIAKK